MDIAAFDSTKVLRRNVIQWMCICFGCLSFTFAIFNLTEKKFYALGFLEVSFCIYCLYTFIRLIKNPLQIWQSVLMCLFTTSIVVLASFISDPTFGSFLWSSCLPVLYYLLLGTRYAFFFSSLLFLFQIAIFLTKPSVVIFSGFNLNLLFSYISMWAVLHMFEFSRADSSKRLKNLALLDPLTGAGNRLSMKHYFDVELKDKSQQFLFLLDIDFFKRINDKYGHDIGDKVLVEVAVLLKVAVPKGYVFRVGGEEFVILRAFNCTDDALVAAEKVRAVIENTTITIAEHDINLTVSIGVTDYKAKQTLTELLKLADQQLYKAKHLGRNKVYIKD